MGGLSWEVLGGGFMRAEGLSPKGLQTDTVVRERINAMTRAERKSFIRLMFTLLESTGAKTLTELRQGGTKAIITMIRTFRELSVEEQETAVYLWDKLFGGRTGEGGEEKRRKEPERKPPKRGKGKTRISFFPLLLP